MKDFMEEKDAEALALMGKAFIKMPRTVAKQMLSENKAERLAGRLYLSLICLCYYAEGNVTLSNNVTVLCRKGEYVGSYRKLSEQVGIDYGSIRRLLAKLKKRKQIEISPVEGGSRIRVCGYLQFILPPEDEKAGPAQPLDEAAKKTIMRKEDTDRNDKTPFF